MAEPDKATFAAIANSVSISCLNFMDFRNEVSVENGMGEDMNFCV